MPFLTQILEKIKLLLASAVEGAKNAAAKLSGAAFAGTKASVNADSVKNAGVKVKMLAAVVLWLLKDGLVSLWKKIAPAAGGLIDRIPEGKRRLFAVLGAANVLIIIIAIIWLANTSDNNRGGEFVQMQLLPIEDFFLPGEPDFVPGVILQRPQRTDWTDEEAGDFWQSVLQYGEEIWRGRIEAMIDEILENVP
ncbi:MAG: hypothetical protein FWG66_03880 [Spirochaetes bacterium]|nr:hypothetical protein [Spirochaetota bacterium]